jgi:3-oxoisoapionate decarboxylase
VTRRSFLTAAPVAAAVGQAASGKRMPMGINTYCLRSLRWDDRQLLDYAPSQKMDAIFLQDSHDPGVMDPAHWAEVKRYAGGVGLHLETGGGSVLPKTRDGVARSVETLRMNIRRASAMGSPLVRCLVASNRAALPPGPIDQHIEMMIGILKSVRSEAMDAGVKLAIEVHKDLLAWQFKELVEAAGTDYVGIYMDTGNPVFVLEHPLTTLETLAPYVLTLHLRDSVVYEHERGVAVQWVPLGEGVVDFAEIVARARELCPDAYVYIKPITGRPPAVLPYLESDFWKKFPDIRAADLARFLALARSGHPYEGHVVIEDLQGRRIPPQFLSAIQFQQREHLERSVSYARSVLDLGVRWRA